MSTERNGDITEPPQPSRASSSDDFAPYDQPVIHSELPEDLGDGGINYSAPYDPAKSNSAFKQFKLISVNFKEAALDSPSFRAYVNHLDNQISKIEKWLQATLSSVKKIPRYTKELQTFCNSFLEHLVPGFLQDGLIDQEYTIQSLQTTLKGLQNLWSISLSSLNVNLYAIENLNMIVTKNVGQYKEFRRTFEGYQEKHDRFLELYLSTPKAKDPVSIMEDSKQLFQVRKDYIHASLDLVIELSTIGNLLDRVLVTLSTDLWKNKRHHGVDVSFFSEPWDRLQKIQSWNESYGLAIDKLRDDMILARNQVEESSIYQFQPSSNINEYKSSLINQRLLNDINEKGFEKHGYLFMKTWTDKSSKPIWVRRWAFIKGGIFGFLILSPSKTFVQESDKIGILLCNVKYTPNEDRRFCFELKTSDLSLVLQAETLVELKSWLKVFSNERNRILGPSSNTGSQVNLAKEAQFAKDSELFNIASGRYPPIISEFSSTIQTTVDRELTSGKITHHSSGQIITPSNLSKHIERNDKLFSKYVYSHILRLKPPFTTDTTKSSILSYSLVSPTSVPTALTANVWGSVNWGVYYLHNAVADEKTISTFIQQDHELIQQQQLHREYGIFYPSYYPKELIALDIQMRALFETAVQPGEYCILSFRCIWSPNSRQELSGRCFITTNHVYFFMQALGFVSLFKGYVGHLVSVEYKRQKQFDLVKLYSLTGVIKMKLFLDDGKAMKLKIGYLIENKISDKPKSMKEILPEFEKIDKQLELERAQEFSNKKTDSFAPIVPELIVSRPENMERSLTDPGTGLTRNVSLGSNRGEMSQSPSLSSNLNYHLHKPDVGSSILNKSLSDESRSSFINANNSNATEFRVDFTTEYDLLSDIVYQIPPKAMFHALLGDNSNILKDQTSFGVIESFVKKPWTTNNEGTLTRTYNTVAKYNKKRWIVEIQQEVSSLVDNEYYSFTHTRSSFKYLIGSSFRVEYKFVCVKIPGDKTRILTYCRRVFDSRSLFNPLIDSICSAIALTHNATLHERLKAVSNEIGTRGPIVKSIYLYGKLSHAGVEEDHEHSTGIEINKPIMKVSFLQVGKAFLTKFLVAIISYTLVAGQLVINAGVLLFKALRLQSILLLVIFVSALFNLFLVGRSTKSYWTVRRANKIAYDYITKDPLMLERAVYLKDANEFIHRGRDFARGDREVYTGHTEKDNSSVSGICFDTFKNKSFVINYREPTYWDDIYGNEETKRVAQDLKKTFQEIGIKRHKLLVELDILNHIEEQIGKAEWRNWLLDEIQRCDYVKSSILDRLSSPIEDEENFEELNLGIHKVLGFCHDCSDEMKYIDLI